MPSVQQLLAAEQDPGANLPQTSKEYDFERLEEGRQRLKSDEKIRRCLQLRKVRCLLHCRRYSPR